MKKRLALLAAIGLMAGSALAAGPAPVRMSIVNVATSPVVGTANSDAVYGYLHSIQVDFPDAGTTCSVAVVITTNNSFEIQREVITTGVISNNAQYFPRVAVCGTNAGALTAYDKIPLANAVLQVRASATLTNKTVHTTVYLSEQP